MTQWKESIQRELSELKEKNLYRELREIENHDGIHARYRGKPVMLFCGNDYLGLSRHPRVVAAAVNAAKKLGVGAGAARLTSGSAPAHRKLEEKIAKHKGFDRALVFSAGYLANIGVLVALADDKTEIIFDKLCHASLIDGAKLSGADFRVFPHNDYERCEELLLNSTAEKKIVITESVFGMDGDTADLEKLAALKVKYNALLFVDDAHGTGVVHIKSMEKADVVTGTLSKAVGAIGGFVVAGEMIAELILNRARPFMFATALPPMICEAAYEAFCVMEEDPALNKKLWGNIHFVEKAFRQIGFDVPRAESAILPIILGDEKKALDAFEKLLEQGIFVPAIRYPTVPKGKARLRVTLSAVHTEQDIQALIEALKKI